MPRPLTQIERERIIALKQSGLRICDICRQMGISRNAAYNWIKRYEAEGHLNRYYRPIYQRATTAEQDGEIVAAQLANPFRPTAETSQQYAVSQRTIQRRLNAAGIHHRRPARKIDLQDWHKQERVSFALEYLPFDWVNNIVIFVDEKTFRSSKDGRQILWRRDGERYEYKNLQLNRDSGRITLGFWGWMSAMGPGGVKPLSVYGSTQYVLSRNRTCLVTFHKKLILKGQSMLRRQRSSVFGAT